MKVMTVAILVAAVLLPQVADARKRGRPGAWVGGSFSLIEAREYRGSRFSDGSFNGLPDDDIEDEGFRAFTGLGFTRFFGMEIGYADFGTASFDWQSDGSGSLYAAGPVSGETSVDGFDLAVRGRIPVGGPASITLRTGLVRWSAESETRDVNGPAYRSEEKGTDLVLGMGLQVAAADHLAFVLDYTIYDISFQEISIPVSGSGETPHQIRALSLGLLIPFGH